MRKLLVLIALLLLTTTPSLAQSNISSGADEYCGSLSEADCELFNNLNTDLPDSTGFELDFNTSITAEGETIGFSIGATGGYVLDPSQRDDALEAVADVALLEFNIGHMLDIIDGTIQSFDGELLFTIRPPAGEVPPMFEEIPLNLWLVDGVGYIDLSPAAMFAPEIDGIYGMNLIESVRFVLSEVTIGDLTEGGRELSEAFGRGFGDGMGSDTFSDTFTESFQTQLQISEEEALAFAEEVLTLERVEDAEIDGMPVAVFEINFDLNALFTSDLFRRGFESNTPSDLDMTSEEFSEALTAAIGDDSQLIIQQYIGLEDNYGYGSDLTLILNLDPQALAEFGDDEMAADADMEPISIEMTLRTVRNQVNMLERITVPDGATVVTPQELQDALEPELDSAGDA